MIINSIKKKTLVMYQLLLHYTVWFSIYYNKTSSRRSKCIINFIFIVYNCWIKFIAPYDTIII